MRKTKSKDKRLLVAKDMPPLYRTLPGQSYAYKADEVFCWISQRPGLLNYLFDKLKESGDIFYDERIGKWQGVDYES